MTAGLRVHIVKAETGEERIYLPEPSSEFDHDRAHIEFMWTEGNFDCDCNRELFFCAAAGETRARDDLQCGNGKFLVTHIEMPNGDVLQIDAASPPT